MKTEVQEKNNIKPLLECIEALPEENLEELYEMALEITQEKKPKKIDKEEKIQYIYGDIIAKYIASLLFLNKNEIKELEDAIYNNKTNKISQNLIDNNYVFKVKDKYLIPEELKGIFEQLNSKKVENDKKNMLVNYYIISNGVLTIDRLIELIKESEFKITKKEILEISKENNYFIKNNVIYLNELVEKIDKETGLINEKESNEYKIVTLDEAMAMMMILESTNATETISKLLKKKIKNKKDLNAVTEIIYNLILLSEDFEPNVEKVLNDFDVNLNEDKLDELYSVLEDICHIIPSWTLNGYTPHEIYCDFEELSDDEKKGNIYIQLYYDKWNYKHRQSS